MNKEIQCRTSTDTFNDLEEKCYRVDSTGASISSGYSVSLLYHYCSKLSRDIYFTTTPNFFYLDETNGTICRVILPSNAPLREVDSLPFPSKDEAKRDACLNACIQLHKLGALTDYLLPHSCDEKKKEPEMDHHKCDSSEDELREELHDMLVPSALKVPWTSFPSVLELYFYIIKLVPNPEDRDYRTFGLFTKDRLPEEAEAMEVELRLAHGRIVQTSLRPVGVVTFDKEEILLAHNFQEMYLKVILDRSELVCDYVTLGGNDATQYESSTFYLMLPVHKQKYGESMAVDWEILKCCLSSPIFGCSSNSHESSVSVTEDTLILSDGPKSKSDIMNSLVYVPHSELFFFIDGILDGLNAYSQYPSPKAPTYGEHYKKRFDIDLSHPEQPFLKAKQLFMLHNLLHSRAVEHTDHIKRSEIPQLNEHFVELPPELCQIKILGFSKDIGSTLSLLPSLMHRLEHLLVAIELKDVLSASFPEGSQIRADCILEALTTEKCMERRSLERFEVLGDAFLKYTVGRHIFLSYEGLDEGELTRKRSRLVNNSNLYELAIKKNLQVYLCDELFDPFQYFALGRPCRAVCDVDTETSIHGQRGNGANEDAVTINAKCTKSHRWLHMKTIADVVESLVGAFLVESGFKAAISFLRWVGIKVDFDVSDVYRVIKESKINMTLSEITDVDSLEESLGYKFTHRSLLLKALVHPSYHKHSVGCYQELEFLGDAVLEYLITSYLFSAYPDLKPGQLTDLRSMTVGNNSFAHIAVWQSFHKHLIKDSNSLTDAINKFECFVNQADSEGDLPEEPACPKVLGDIVESCFGAVLLDTGFDLTQVWRLMLKLLEPVLGFSTVQFNPVRVVRELCQRHNLDLGLPDPVEVRGGYFVKVEVKVKDQHFTFSATNHNSKAARRMAAQEAVSKLKSLGYKHKKINKSLEEILRATRKKEAKLVGFNEEPIDVKDAYDSISPEEMIRKDEPRLTGFVEEPIDIKFVDVDLILLQKLQIREAEEVPPKSCLPRTEKKIQVQESERIPPKSRPLPNTEKASSSNHQHSLASRPVRNPKDVITEEERIYANKTARSQLFEICTANHWPPPQFISCKEEGPNHLKVFTYRVTLQMTTGMCMECYSEPHLTKKAAQEHAAEGVLWCLKHLGYLHNH